MRIFIFLFCFIAFHTVTFAQMRANLEEEIGKILYYDVQVNYDKTPGFVVGLIIGDSSFVFNYGSLSRDSIVPPDEHTLFELGGLTKVFTATLIEQLVKEEKMSYDSSLNLYLPPQYQNEKASNITISSLLTHTSGLPKMPFDFGAIEKALNNPYAHYTTSNLMDFYKQYIDVGGFGQYNYSHVGYALLQVAIEEVSGKTFEESLQEKVFRPTALNNTGVELSPKQQVHLAKGHAISGKTVLPWQFQSFEASEGLKSNMKDLLSFIRLNVEDADNTFSNIHLPVARTDMSKNTFAGYGWHVIKMKKHPDLILHQGSTSGFRCSTGFVKETRTAVVILSNSEFGLNGLGYHIIRMLNNNWKKRK